MSYRVVMPCTHGKTREEAIRNGEEVIEMYLEAWQAEGESIPEPNTLQIAPDYHSKFIASCSLDIFHREVITVELQGTISKSSFQTL